MDLIEEALRQGADYCDVRHDIKRMYNLVRESKKTVSDGVQVDAGVCLRVLVDGSWGVGIATREENLFPLLPDVIRSARALKRDTTKVKEAPSETVKAEKRAKKRFSDDNSKLDLLRSLESSAYERINSISSMNTTLAAAERSLRILTSEEREIETHVDRISLRLTITCKRGDTLESRTRVWGGIGGMEYLLGRENTIREDTNQLAWEADTLLEAEHSPSTVIDCVLSHTLTGTLLHEAFGHAVEADAVVTKKSVLTGRIGEKVAAPCVTMVDDPTAPLFGYYLYDHEGIKAQPTTIVENGVLKSFLHSRETAALLDAPLTGHCKAEFYSTTPLVRQGNTILNPHDYTFPELLEVKEGLFLGDSAGGQASVGDGSFTFATQYARVIKDGELGAYLKGCSLSGHVLETMKSIDAVGKGVEAVAGLCVKGQTDSQGWLVPCIRVRKVMVGGRGQ